ncbi:MAG TPA: penicillin-binding transpeptidase domain-containing protein [Acidimicrobiia bacterium]|nr:penicillin-binding transpeptidase domain-containing protein [Acidimicrobiia bacterium]
MNRAIRRVGIGVTVLILLLVGQLTYLQVYDADHLANDPRNIRFQLRDFSKPRGRILTSDDQVVARSVETGDELKFQRLYPQGALFSQVAGYQSFVFGNTGVERTYNNELAGRDPLLQIRNVGDLLAGKEPIGNVVLSMSASLQAAARDALGAQRGSVVVLNPKTGEILAMYSNPSYDPQPFASHNSQAVQDYEKLLRANPDKPDLPRAYRERFPPGSTFKVITSSVALGTGRFTPQSTFPVLTELDLPQTNNTLRNFGGEACGGTLALSFQESCNTTFGQIGLDLGNEFVPGMQRFGIGAAPPLDVAPGAAASVGPPPGSFQTNQPLFAFAGIGQGDVAVTPLQMALSASAVANNGQIMQPHVADRITDGDDNTVKTIGAKGWQTAMTPQVAATVTQLMVSVVERGTGTAARIPGVSVAGKTGTAQVQGAAAPHAWFVGFAPVEDPQVAVAVIVEHGGSAGSEATGGRVAAPIAAQMMRMVLGR